MLLISIAIFVIAQHVLLMIAKFMLKKKKKKVIFVNID